MNKLLCLSLLILLIENFAISQNKATQSVVVEYQHYRSPRTSPFIIDYKSYLQANSDESTYEIYLSEIDSSRSIINDKGSHTMLYEKNNSYYYKNFENGYLINREKILMKKFYIEDGIDLFDWELKNEKKEILGHECKRAEVSFRGDRYIAYYAPDVPISNGPWKFHGLPGLILDVRSADNIFRLIAKSIEFANENLEIIKPYQDKKIISRAEFEALYKKKYNEVNRYNEEGVTFKMSKGAIEIIVTDDN